MKDPKASTDRAASTGPRSRCGSTGRPVKRWVWAVAMLVGMFLIVCVTVYWQERRRLRDNTDLLDIEWIEAQASSSTTGDFDYTEQTVATRHVVREAFDAVAALLADYPDAPDVICLLGFVYSRFGNRPKAVECWERALEANPSLVAAHYCLGRQAFDAGDYEKSVGELNKALEIDPGMSDAHLLLARALMHSGRMEEAVAALENHLRLSPRSAPGYFRLGQAYLQQDECEQAKQCLLAAIEINPFYTECYNSLATACTRLGETDAAADYRGRFQELKTKHLEIVSAMKRASSDLEAQRKSLADVLVSTGKIYLDRGDVKKAEDSWLKAAKRDPKDAESRQLLVSFYEPRNRIEEALPLQEQLTGIEPNKVVHFINLGVLSRRLQKWDEAEKAFRKIIALAPNRPGGYVALVELFLQTDRNLAEAKEFGETAVRLQPIASNYFNLGIACQKNSDRPGALAALGRAAKLDPGNVIYRQAKVDLQGEK